MTEYKKHEFSSELEPIVDLLNDDFSNEPLVFTGSIVKNIMGFIGLTVCILLMGAALTDKDVYSSPGLVVLPIFILVCAFAAYDKLVNKILNKSLMAITSSFIVVKDGKTVFYVTPDRINNVVQDSVFGDRFNIFLNDIKKKDGTDEFYQLAFGDYGLKDKDEGYAMQMITNFCNANKIELSRG